MKEPTKHKQIESFIIDQIDSGTWLLGSPIPSINQLAARFGVARETVVKTLRILQQRGILMPVRGKGFFVVSESTLRQTKVLLLFDAFTPYKETLLTAFRSRCPQNSVVEIFFHHYNFGYFNRLLRESSGNYTHYVILTWEHSGMEEALKVLPPHRLYLLDRWPTFQAAHYCGVYQDFYADLNDILGSIRHLIKKYTQLTLVFRNAVTQVPAALESGFKDFMAANHFTGQVVTAFKPHMVDKGEAFLVIDDEDLVLLVEEARRKHLTPGHDVGIISYNETSMKRVIDQGISVISTDFEAMGHSIARMVFENLNEQWRNPSCFIDRQSF